jgi:hypothetical protein
MEYILGIITGLVIAVLTMVTLIYFKPSIERTAKQIVSRVRMKGEIIEPENEELESWVNKLKQE